MSRSERLTRMALLSRRYLRISPIIIGTNVPARKGYKLLSFSIAYSVFFVKYKRIEKAAEAFPSAALESAVSEGKLPAFLLPFAEFCRGAENNVTGGVDSRLQRILHNADDKPNGHNLHRNILPYAEKGAGHRD